MKIDPKMKESLRQFLLYLIVGALATLVEWVLFYLLDSILKLTYMPATAIAFAVSTFANWGFGRLILFGGSKKSAREIIEIYVTAAVGLALNLLIMYVCINGFSLPDMFAKVIATGLVFIWNFLIRKFVIYKI